MPSRRRSPRTTTRTATRRSIPIKVNQQRLVVEEVYRYGEEFGFGLEVGSKPELLAVMAMTENAPERLIICNGFKDDSYIEAVIARHQARPHHHPGGRELRRAAD